jgi:enoyl-[acyl-carrier protein] reductase I
MLENKFGVVFGVANKRSIAWASAQALAGAGARLAFTYQNERLRENVESLTKELPGAVLSQCDVVNPGEVAQTFARVKEEFGRLDFLVHSLAFAPREALEGDYVNTSLEAFQTALEISAYSLTTLARAAQPLMTEGGSIVSMSYYGASTRYLASDLGRHNIRVNAISAGPLNTLAARGVGNMGTILKHHAERAPLRRNVEAREVGDTALFLCSPLSSGITGEVIHVDCGYNIMAF